MASTEHHEKHFSKPRRFIIKVEFLNIRWKHLLLIIINYELVRQQDHCE